MNVIVHKICKVVNNPWLLLAHLSDTFYWLFTDKLFLSIKFRTYLGKWIDWNNPKMFNEKLQWMKIYNRISEYTKMVDKYEVKQYVSNLIGEEYIIPTLGVYNSFDEIDFEYLPNQFVLKCTHDSGGLIICKDKTLLDLNFVRRKIETSLKRNYYNKTKEWPYKNVKPRIIVEQFKQDESGELRDYKFYCFNGKVECILVCVDRTKNVRYYYFDKEWNFLPYDIKTCKKDSVLDIKKPENFDCMISIAEKLSKDIPHVRIDLYNLKGKIYFGEYTFFSQSGLDRDITVEADYILGKKITLI